MRKILALVLMALIAFPLSASAKLAVGSPMVPFTLTADDGKIVDSAALVGKGVIVLNFMNTVCSTCVSELTAVKKLSAENPKVQFFPIAVDMRGLESVKQFKAEQGFAFTFLLDPKFEVARKYNASSTPVTVVIGNDGMIKSFIYGYNDEDIAGLQEAFKK